MASEYVSDGRFEGKQLARAEAARKTAAIETLPMLASYHGLCKSVCNHMAKDVLGARRPQRDSRRAAPLAWFAFLPLPPGRSPALRQQLVNPARSMLAHPFRPLAEEDEEVTVEQGLAPVLANTRR